MKARLSTLLMTCLLLSGASSSHSQDQRCNEEAMLVFDGSGSMSESGFNGLHRARIKDARAALREVLPDITPHRDLGLVVYGPTKNVDLCNSVEVRFSPIPNAAEKIISEIDALEPSGLTPLSQAALRAAETLNFQRKPAVIVMVTDGEDTCGGKTCELGSWLSKFGKNLKVHVIGFRVRDPGIQDNSPNAAQCLSDRTGGKYLTAETTEELVAALEKTLSCQVLG